MTTKRSIAKTKKAYLGLGSKVLLNIHRFMVRTRLVEEHLISLWKKGDGVFWTGGPGEEAFNVPLGLLIKKGQGPAYDYLHPHYRSSGIVLAMGVEAIDVIRQMRSTATDPYSNGRNFVNHYAIPKWNVIPVSSPVGSQYSTAIGTAIAQKQTPGDAVSIAIAGDATAAEGDFHSCLVWANRPALPLPILIVITNNGCGISTSMESQHGEKRISDWGKAFDMPARTINGNDPVESYIAVREALSYCRKERRPYLLEAKVSRLYGHASSSGANRSDDADCIADFESQLIGLRLITQMQIAEAWKANRRWIDEADTASKNDPPPTPASLWDHVFTDGIPSSYPRRNRS